MAEFETHRTLEAICAHDADHLECLIQAIEYRHAGYTTVGGWITSSLDALRTQSAKAIADAAQYVDPLAWRRPPPTATD